jgi:hypothetical protein
MKLKHTPLDKDKFKPENWVNDLYATTRFKFGDARRALLNGHLNDIEELQKNIVELNNN